MKRREGGQAVEGGGRAKHLPLLEPEAECEAGDAAEDGLKDSKCCRRFFGMPTRYLYF